MKAKIDLELKEAGIKLSGELADVKLASNGFPENVVFSLSTPKIIDLISLAHRSANNLADQGRVIGMLDDGRHFEGTLNLVESVTFAQKDCGTVNCVLFDSQVSDGKPTPTEATWCYAIANLSIYRGDEATVISSAITQSQQKVFNRIRFSVGGREWVLTDHLVGCRKKLEPHHKANVLHTGSLETVVIPDEDLTALNLIADDICDLLSLALGKGIRWDSRTKEPFDSNRPNMIVRSVWLPPFGAGGGEASIINNEKSVLKCFLETAYPALAEKRVWLRPTLDLYLQARLNSFVEVKCTLLNILLDRMAQQLTKDLNKAQISESIAQVIGDGEFLKGLHEALSKLGDKWTEAHTKSVVQRIKEMNSRPSFASAIIKACRKLSLKEPSSEFLNKRHRLLHEGQLDPADEAMLAYCLELDCLVLLMILRLLGYDGPFQHRHYGFKSISLRDLMVVR